MNPTFRVLYAEDNALDADLTRSHFSEKAPDFEIEIVETGQACLDKLSGTGRDLLLLDHHLPDMEGLDVLRTLVRASVPVPVVMVTGSGDDDLVVKALRLGASNYVPKLGNYLETLPDLLRRVVEEHRLKQSQKVLATAPRRILYVEHDAMDIELTLRHFTEAAPEFEIDVIQTCSDALARLAKPPAYDAALIDLRMPDQNGLDFVREAKRLGLPLPPFIMISGKGDEAAAIASLKLGAADYIAKREGYLNQLTYTIDRAIAYDRLDRLNAQLQAELAERKRAEEALRFQKMLLESQGEASIDGILNVDASGKIIWYNRRFSEMWGISQDLLQLRSDEVALQAVLGKLVDCDSFQKKIRDLYAQPDARSRDEIHLKDGRVFDRYSGPVTDERGDYLGRIWLFRDVTEERKLQASVAQSDRLASMGMLAAGVAHEINNPLSYILYNLESLAEDIPRYATQLAKVRGALVGRLGEAGLRELLGNTMEVLDPAFFSDVVVRFKDALGGTHRIKDIARGIGTFSRVEQDRVAPVDLRYPIESAINITFNEIKYRASIVTHFGTTSRVLASDGRLSQVFLNLLVNAAQAILEGDVEHNKISVRTWQEGNDIFAEVQDTGCGIPPENLQRIFDPFFTTKPVGVGSGLGLNIVKNIITGYGGEIAVTSEVGKGARFVIRLPAAVTEGDDAESVATEERGATRVSGRVLVIDDEPAIRGVLKRMLRGHEVVEADSGDQGREVLSRDQRFDVILCDMMMPKISGMDVHRWLLDHHPQLARKVVFITGGAFTPKAREYLEKVDNLRLEKPFDLLSFEKMVAELVSASKAKG
jgi:signal transduction histidine kinase/CheY-like chemotaxis protein